MFISLYLFFPDWKTPNRLRWFYHLMIESTSRNSTSVCAFICLFFFCILCLICLPEEEEKRKKKSPTWLSIVILDDVVITSAKWPSRKASRLLILPARAWSCFHCSTLFMLITPHSSVTRPGLCPAPCSCIFILLKCHRDCSDSNTHSDV